MLGIDSSLKERVLSYLIMSDYFRNNPILKISESFWTCYSVLTATIRPPTFSMMILKLTRINVMIFSDQVKQVSI